MIDLEHVIKYLFIENKSNKEIAEFLIKKGSIMGSSEFITKQIEKFDEKFESIVITNDEFKLPKLIEACYDGAVPLIIAWNRNPAINMKTIKENYENNIFLLDDDVRIYSLPENIHYFGYYIDDDGNMHIIDQDNIEYLTTDSFERFIWFIIFTCKYLLVTSEAERQCEKPHLTREKKIEITNYFYQRKKQLPDEYLVASIMAIPNEVGTFANCCLKSYGGQVAFVDSTDDIEEIISEDESKIENYIY